MPKKKGAELSGNTFKDYIANVTKLEYDQLWLYALAIAVAPGSRIIPADVIHKRLGLKQTDAESIEKVLFDCARSIAFRELAPASASLKLIEFGMDIERATLLTDIATSAAAYLEPSNIARFIITPLEERLTNIEKALSKSKSE
jgi:hypothetical protein